MCSGVPSWLRVAVGLAVVGWGANQFAALLPVYRDAGMSASYVSLAFTTYMFGLVPALFVAARIGDRSGPHLPVRAAVVLGGLASVVLAAGTLTTPLLLVGRFVAGVAAGAVLGPGTAWVTNLSADRRAAPRRVAIALSIGFGGGPLVAGLLAQWARPADVIPYALHIAITLVAAGLVWSVRPTHEPVTGGPGRHGLWPTLRSPDFWAVIPWTAPWVFGAATMSLAVAPTVLRVPAYDTAVDGVIAGLTLGTGVAIQPVAQRLERRRAGGAMLAGLVALAAGMTLVAAAFQLGWAVLMVPCALILGSAYGLLLVAGLRRMELLGEPGDRARLNSVFYALTYLGFAVPLVFSLTTSNTASQVVFALAGAAVATATAIAMVLTRGRANASDPPERSGAATVEEVRCGRHEEEAEACGSSS